MTVKVDQKKGKEKKEKEEKVKVWLPELISAALIHELPGNSQKQSKHEFKELRESIRTAGFDESLLVKPEGDGYVVVSGNHRFRAGKAEGMTEFPCVVRDDWDDVESVIQSVRRNYVRGKIDRDAFTAQVNALSEEHSLEIDLIYEQMGFEDPDAFAAYYKKEEDAQRQITEDIEKTTAPAVRILEDIGSVVGTILAEHGHTVPHSFIVFPVGNKNHMYVASTATLKKGLEAVVEYCVSRDIDINIALGGLLQIGIAHSGFFKDPANTEQVKTEGTKETGTGDLDLVAPDHGLLNDEDEEEA